MKCHNGVMLKLTVILAVFLVDVLGHIKDNVNYAASASIRKGCPYMHHKYVYNSQKNLLTRPRQMKREVNEDSDPNPLIIPAINSTNAVGYLSEDEINIADTCFSQPECNSSAHYRTYDGSCNNLRYPTWGQSGLANIRIIQADYSDGVSQPRKAKSGNDLPNARKIRTTIFPNWERSIVDRNLHMVELGQIIAHDTTLGVLKITEDGKVPQCCTSNHSMPENLPKECISVAVPDDDLVLERRCINITRNMDTRDLGCDITPVRQVFGLTSFIDGSMVYGSNEGQAYLLRAHKNGKLVTQEGPEGTEFLPNVENPEDVCFEADNDTICYTAGDLRVNQHPLLAVHQIVLLRLHNDICDELLKVNPHWDDDRTYLEARRLFGAIYQHIIYNEYLPSLLGKDFVVANKLLPVSEGFIDGYDEYLNPTTITSFEAAAFRLGHNFVPGHAEILNSSWDTTMTESLSGTFNQVLLLQQPGIYEGVIKGMLKQPALKADRFFTKEITDKLFIGASSEGDDLISIDIQRGRDYGEPSYNKFRQLCGLPVAKNFSDLNDTIPLKSVNLLQELYEDVDDIDFYVGGLLENNRPGALMGPTFQCIVGEMFYRWKYGDSFYYEFNNRPGSLTLDQLNQIKNSSLALVLCVTTQVDSVPRVALNQYDDDQNPRVPCDSIPWIDFSPWKEYHQ